MRSIYAVVVLLMGLLGFCSVPVWANMMVLEGIDNATVTTGDFLDGIGSVDITTNVVEIQDLLVTARSGDGTQVINTTTTSLGINAAGSGDDTDAFDAGESMFISFNKDIRINLLDFNLFDDPSESFTISVTGQGAFDIAYDDLANQTSAFFTTNLVITAGTEIGFFTSSPTPIGLDGIDLDVIPEPTVIGLISLAGIGALVSRRFVD